MPDKLSQYIISVGGDASDLQSIFTSIKSRVRSDVAELERITNSADLFSQLTANIPKIEQAMQRATARASELRDQIAKIESTGGKATDELTKSLAAAEKAAAAATKEYARQNTELSSLSSKLKAGGVDTSKLASEQLRLADAMKQATAAAAQQSSKDLLGFTISKDIEPQIAKINAAFDTLKKSGTLSATEIAAAQKLTEQKISELRGTVTQTGTAFEQFGKTAEGAMVGLLARTLAPTAAFVTLSDIFQSTAKAAREFSDGLAQISTVANVSKDQLRALGDDVRKLSQDLGLDLQQTLKATFDLIRSGVAPENAISVVKDSAIAAKAAFADLGAGAKTADALLSAFGVSEKDLARALDIVAAGAKNGGLTLAEFGDNVGAVGNVARAVGIDFEEFVSILTVLKSSGLSASEATSALQKILVNFNTADVREKLRDLGLEGANLTTVFAKLAERHLGIDDFLQLGFANTKAAAAVAVLSTNSERLRDVLERTSAAAGTNAAAFAQATDTAAERSARFSAALKETNTEIGLLFGSGSLLQAGATAKLRELNDALGAFANFKATNLETTLVSTARAFINLSATGRVVRDTLDAVINGLDSTDSAAAAAANAVSGAGIKLGDALREIADAKAKLAAANSDLVAQAQVEQTQLTRDLADLQSRADAEIAALDRSAKAARDTAVEKLRIELQLTTDKLALIRKGEADITAVIQANVTEREKIERSTGVNEAKIAAESAQTRINALAPVLAEYQKLYSNIVALAQASADKVNSIEQTKIEFNRSIDKVLRDIRTQGLSEFDTYLSKVDEVNRLIAEARETAQRGGTENLDKAKQLTDEAVQTAQSIGTAVTTEGVQIVTQLQAQTTKTELIQKAQAGFNQSLKDAGDAAKSGRDAFETQSNEVGKIIAGLQKQYDDLKKSIADGVTLRIDTDLNSVAAARATLDELTKPRTVTITVNTVGGGGGAAAAPSDTGFGMNDRSLGGLFNRGGYVGRALRSAAGPIAQAYASGGPVFRQPLWRKVPGIGDGDTVAAMLQAGSFVVRKAASRFYGDGVMAQLARDWPAARRFASGGAVRTATGQGFTLPSNDKDYNPFSSFVGAAGSVSPPKLPSDPAELRRLVLNYVEDVKAGAFGDSGGYFFWRDMLEAMGQAKKTFETFPTDENLLVLLQFARAIGLNLGAKSGTLTGFDVDGRKWHKERVFTGNGLFGNQNESALSYSFYNRGGGTGSDRVRALLTPGEWVIPKPAAAALGTNLLTAINAMRVAPHTLAGLVAHASMPAPRRFATGGPVPGAAIPSRGAPGAGGDTYNISFAIDGRDLLSEEAVRRKVIPVLRDALQRSR